jgi:hypothetical protein
MALLSTTNLARLSARHPWRAVIAWVVALVVFGGLLQVPFPLQTTTDTKLLNNPESVQGWDLLIERGIRQERPGVETVVVCNPGTRQSTGKTRTSLAAPEARRSMTLRSRPPCKR